MMIRQPISGAWRIGLGVASIILTNLVLLPVFVSYLRVDDAYRNKISARSEYLKPMWSSLSHLSDKKPAAAILVVAAILFIFGAWKGPEIKIGDMHQGVPELRSNSR